ncbi:MAG: tetratricopeptide repeat protein [Chitinophagales bacterium]|nr:tetratricopeptide repeat protein [Chitinophagaceae bacterium]MCB9065371.1 tetratricopeptide repeat protein [Chitinophagales bacterium]
MKKQTTVRIRGAYAIGLRYAILCITFVFLSIGANAKYEHLLNKTYAQRYLEIDSLFYYNFELRKDIPRFEAELQLLMKEARAANDIELECEATLLSIANNSVGDESRFHLVEPEAQELLEKAKEHKLTQIRVRARQYLGRFYMEKKRNYIRAIDEFMKSYYLMKKLDVADFPLKKECMYNVAHAYYTFGDMEDAKKYMMAADQIVLPGNMTMKDIPNKAYTYISLENTLGLIYRQDEHYDSAIYYFQVVRDLAANVGDSLWMGIATGNIGICYFLQQDYQKAIPLLEYDIDQSFKGKEYDNGINSLLKLAEIYLHYNDMSTMKLLLDSARYVLDKTYEPAQHMQHLGLMLAKYYSSVGNQGLAYRYMDTSLTAKKEIDEKKNAMQLANQQNKLQLQEHRAELQKNVDDKNLQLLKRNILMFGILVLAVFAIMFVNRQKEVYRQRSRLAEYEQHRAEMVLTNARKQLEVFTNSIREKNQLIEQFSETIAQNDTSTSNKEQEVDNETIHKLQQSILLTDEQWDEFRELFETVHVGFLNRLKEKLPELTPAETRFMALSKLKLSNKEMAGMLGIGLSGMRNYKYRLRKKLNIADDSALESLIHSV